MKRIKSPIEGEFYTYEEFIVDEILRSKNKGYISKTNFVDKELNIYADIYAPDGILYLDLKGKTVVEVKKFLSYASIKGIEADYKRCGEEYNFLVVYFESSVSNIPSRRSNEKGKVLDFISFKELKGNAKEKAEKRFYRVKLEKENWQSVRNDIIKSTKRIVEQGNNVLFLGAGVSASAQMPSWEDLLKGLMGEVKQLKASTLKAFKELNSQVFEECGDSYLIMARYLQTAIHLHNDKELFAGLIQKYLYNDKDTSPLLTVLAHLIQQKKITEVITYNFDDVLERNLDKLNLTDSIDYTSISKDAEVKAHNTLPIYHVHGIIPKEGPVDTVVFSEEEYHDRYTNSFHWSNIEQLHALTRMHCFFIGLSMNDPNLRRLLDVAQKMNRTNAEQHYAFLRRTKLENYCKTDIHKTCKYLHVSESLIDANKQAEIYHLNYSILERMFLDLGVRIIWFEDFDELPGLIADVFGMNDNKQSTTNDLIEICEKRIVEIKQIEDGVPTYSAITSSLTDFVNFIEYKRKNGDKYKSLITEVGNMLNELSDRIDLIHTDAESILELQKQVPKYYENLTGYATFYKIWLDNLKLFNQ